MNPPILVTGATGNVGLKVAKGLTALGQPVRAADINTDTIRQRLSPSGEAVRLDFADPATFAPALNGVRSMFLMRPPAITDVQKYIFPLIDAAKAAGVGQVVFLSLIGIEQNQKVPHYAVEQYLRASGLAWTFLRASFFMQNLNTQHRAEIRERSEIFIPVGRARTSFIDVRDIGAVAALALCQPGHENQAYDLTGGEAIDYYQASGVLSRELGRPIIYRDPSTVSFLVRRVRTGTPLGFALVMAMLYRSTRQGMADTVTGEVQRLLGRPPISFDQYVRDYRQFWLP